MNAHILIIEDEPALRRSLTTILKQSHYQVTATDLSNAALLYLLFQPADLVILAQELKDLNDPGMLSSIHQIAPETKVIVFSTDGREETIAKTLQNEIQAYVIKPIEPEALLQVIEEVLCTQRIPLTNNVIPGAIGGDTLMNNFQIHELN